MRVKRKNADRDVPYLRAIGRRLRQVRGFDLTQEAFAEQLGVSQSQLSKYERGLILPPAEVLLRVKQEFKVSVDWLLTGVE
jgi:transcriptional regulator with XRE-family HTH domain